jgi:ribonuclease D
MQTISSNFPLFGTKLLPKLTNLVCLHVAAKTIRGDVDLCNAVFGEEPPDDLNLAALVYNLLHFKLDKNEQMSVWCCRPLRKAQRSYAAKDSYAVVELTKVLIKAINK